MGERGGSGGCGVIYVLCYCIYGVGQIMAMEDTYSSKGKGIVHRAAMIEKAIPGERPMFKS